MRSGQAAYLAEIAQIFSTGDVRLVHEIFADTYVDHQRPDWIDFDGPAEFIAIVESARSSLPDLRVQLVAEPIRHQDLEVAILRWVSRSADEVVVERDTVETLRIENGQVAEHWGVEVRSVAG